MYGQKTKAKDKDTGIAVGDREKQDNERSSDRGNPMKSAIDNWEQDYDDFFRRYNYRGCE